MWLPRVTRGALPASYNRSMTSPHPPRRASTAAGPAPVSPYGDALSRDELAAALAARRELGPDYDAAFADAVVERIERSLDARLGARQVGGSGTVLAVVSLLAAIPLTAIAVVNAGTPGLLVVWAAITLINVAHALRRR